MSYINLLLCSVAVLSVTANLVVTKKDPSKIKNTRDDLERDLQRYKVAVQRLTSHVFDNGVSERFGSRTRTVSISSPTNGKRDRLAHQDADIQFEGDHEGCNPELPAAMDMAYQPEEQRFRDHESNHHQFIPEYDGIETRQRRPQKQHRIPAKHLSHIFDFSKDIDEDELEDEKYSTRDRVSSSFEVRRKHSSENNKQNLDFRLHKSSRKNYTNQSDLTIPAAIDLAFRTGPTKSPSRNTQPTPTKLYWPPTSTTRTTAKQICRSKIDLGFLVESSRSVARTGPGNYRRLMNFVKHVVLKFSIRPTATRVGVVTYANRPYLLLGFNQGQRVLDVLQSLTLPSHFRHQCWTAQTGLALSFVNRHLFGCSCSYSRRKVLVVVTDGRSSDGIYFPSRILKQNGVKILTVGVGRYFNIHQLNAMASRPVKKNVFTGDFSKIHHVRDELVRQICNVADGSMVPSRSSPCKC